MTEGSALAQFLRARRSLVQPADVGLPAGGRRRVAGLRREEVAMLANISTDYYLRLEQGREEHPSDQVLTSLSRALKLDGDAVTYMRNLMRHQFTDGHVEPLQELHPALGALIDGWSQAAVCVVDPGMTVVLANGLAGSLSPHHRVGSNVMWELFVDPRAPEFYLNWEILTAWSVRVLRASYGQRPDPALVRLVDGLVEQSPRFRELWERHDIRHRPAGGMSLNHPRVGILELNFQQMVLPATGHVLVAYWADRGSASEDGMRILAAG
ncbi:transcriptional regulator [Mycobacterium sp. 1100029.7]|nr:transcriptional regulator [Mycobacterium sp. 1100029.7]